MGNRDATMDASVRVDLAVQPAYELSQGASDTLQSGNRERTDALRAKLIEATLDALAEPNHPRLARSLYPPKPPADTGLSARFPRSSR